MTNTTGPVRTDRLDAARYPDVAHQLRTDARYYRELIPHVITDRTRFDTFAEPVRNLLRKHYEEIQVALEEMADTAQAFADQARERLGVAS